MNRSDLVAYCRELLRAVPDGTVQSALQHFALLRGNKDSRTWAVLAVFTEQDVLETLEALAQP